MSQLTTIASGLRFPEGPVAMPDGSVILTEIAAGRVTRVKADGSTETVAETGGGPNGLAVGPDGKLYCCNNGGFGWVETQGLLVPHGTASDYRSGSIQRIEDQVEMYKPTPVPMTMRAGMESAAPQTPVTPGEIEITARVTLTVNIN